ELQPRPLWRAPHAGPLRTESTSDRRFELHVARHISAKRTRTARRQHPAVKNSSLDCHSHRYPSPIPRNRRHIADSNSALQFIRLYTADNNLWWIFDQADGWLARVLQWRSFARHACLRRIDP